jgi:hypothetical protein
MQRRNHSLAHYVERLLVLLHLSVCTQGFIQGKSHFAVHCERNPSEIQKILRYTHIRIHTGVKPFTCPHCSKSCTTTSNLRAHVRVHRNKPYCCTLCSESSSLLASLKLHTGEKQLCCLVFKKSFHRSSVLRKQLKMTVKLNLTVVLGVLTTLLVYTFWSAHWRSMYIAFSSHNALE